ncbi:MAG: hypothetical protein WBR26_17415 [Candidatus Acidiferrum sp.]
MDLVWLAALVLGAAFAIAGGQKLKWRLLNLGIILGCMALGYGIGYAAGLGSGNMGRVQDIGWPLALMLGIVAALGCLQLNRWHEN